MICCGPRRRRLYCRFDSVNFSLVLSHRLIRVVMKSGSAAKLIVEALLQRFLPLARQRIDTAQAQVRPSPFGICVLFRFFFSALRRCSLAEFSILSRGLVKH